MMTTRRIVLASSVVVSFAILASCTSLDGLNGDTSANEGGAPDSSVDAAVVTHDEAAARDASPACSADLAIDSKSCGACGQDCTNGVCAGGLCTLTTNLSGAASLALRGDRLYLGTLDQNGNLLSCATNGCQKNGLDVVGLAPGAGPIDPINIAVSDTFLVASNYMADNGGGANVISLSGGALTRLPPATLLARSYGIAVDATTVYFTTAGAPGNLHYCDLPTCAGGLRSAAVTTNGVLVAVAPSGALVWTEDGPGGLKTCASKTACVPSALVADPSGPINDLKIDGGVVYWGTGQGGVFSCALGGCANAVKLVEEAGVTVEAIAVSGADLYWAVEPFGPGNTILETQGAVRTCKIASCAASTRTIASMQHDPNAIVLDDRSVYWTNSGARAQINGMSVLMKAPR